MNRAYQNISRLLGGMAILAALTLLAACGGSSTSSSTATPTATSIGGHVMGGRQPVVGAAVYVYEAGLNAGDAPQQIGAASTDSNGAWSIAGFSPVPANGQLIYVVTQGGNPGAGTNNQAVFMTVAGIYGSSNFPSSVASNELTTVASASAFQSYIAEVTCSSISGSTATSGTCPSISGATGLVTAAGTLTHLIDVTRGTVNTTLASAASGTADYTTLTRLNSLASILAACINSTGGTSGTSNACGNLLSAANNQALGTLSATAISTFSDSNGPLQTVAAPDGTKVFVLDGANPLLSSYSIDASGTFTLLQSTALPIAADGMSISPDGQYLYVPLNSHNVIWTYSVAADGTLTFLSSTTDSNLPYDVAITADGQSLFTADSSSIGLYSISSGITTAVSSWSYSYGTIYKIAVSPDGKYVFVSDSAKHVTTYTIGAGPTLTYASQITVGTSPRGLYVSKNSQLLYVADNSATGKLSVFSIGATGGLTLSSSIAARSNYSISPSADGNLAYASSLGKKQVATYVVGPAVDTLQAALHIAISSKASLGTALFGQLPAPSVYSPVVSSAPANWSLSN